MLADISLCFWIFNVAHVVCVILFLQTPWLDGKHVVFGTVSGGMEVVKAIEAVGSSGGATRAPVVIADCGEIVAEPTPTA